mmetsp:Transcript_15490/g.30291  ORF Transcript_15490/g.30291 Transcript_15490/m.30291 type:complete len:81 (+) Transcript_15490:117-359(+)
MMLMRDVRRPKYSGQALCISVRRRMRMMMMMMMIVMVMMMAMVMRMYKCQRHVVVFCFLVPPRRITTKNKHTQENPIYVT